MKFIVMLALAMIIPTSALAQSTLDEIEAEIGSRTEELRRAEKLLADPDSNRRLAAMEALLKSGDPALVDKAKEVGLFSDDPRLRAAAVRAILDAGGAFRAEFEIPKGESDLTPIYEWLKAVDGSWSSDGSTGYFGFAVGEYDNEDSCWRWLNSRYCAFRMSGETVMTANWRHGNDESSAVMRLDETGALKGDFLVDGQGTPVTIRIPLDN